MDKIETTTETTCAKAVVDTLIGHGIDTIYCVPGIQNDWFFNAVHDAGNALRAVHTRHEQGAAYMALGAALATGRPAAYSVVPGPGVLNTTAALATAYSTNARVLCLTGQIHSRMIGRGYGVLHEIPDQLGILERLTKHAARSTDPSDAARQLALAFQAMNSLRPRPVSLEIAPDTLAAKGTFPAHPVLEVPSPPMPDAGTISAAASLLAKAERPMIQVGGGAIAAAPWVKTLAERVQAPVVSYRMGRGVLDDRHPLAITVPHGHRLWPDCDLLLAIGTRMQSTIGTWGADDKLKVIRVEIDAKEMNTIREPDVALVGRAEDVLPRLAAEVDMAAPRRASRSDEMRALKAQVARELAVLDPQIPYLAAIRDALGEDGILVEELTQVGYVARAAYPVYRPRTYISSGYQGTLGWGYPVGLGVKDALPSAPVVSINGDGGFMFNVQELSTAIRHRIPAVCVVFNDGAYGNVKRMQQEDYGNRVIATDLTNPDFVAMARSFGAAAYRAETPAALRTTLATALGRNEPSLIEVPCGPMPSPWPLIQLPRIRGLKPR